MKLDPQQLEENIQEAIANTPGVRDVSEREYCERVLDALDGVKAGIAMRLEEINREDEELADEES